MSKVLATSISYPIRAVSRMTGIGIDTLRAWEHRYAAVTPIRDDRGRMYTDADVARLRLLSGAVEQGHSIGRLAGLSNDELRDLCGAAGAVALPGAGAIAGRYRLEILPLEGLDLTRVNSEHAPDYSRIDVRGGRTFSVSGQPLNVFFGVQNMTNRRNFASYNWNRRINSQQFGEQQDLRQGSVTGIFAGNTP